MSGVGELGFLPSTLIFTVDDDASAVFHVNNPPPTTNCFNDVDSSGTLAAIPSDVPRGEIFQDCQGNGPCTNRVFHLEVFDEVSP